MNENIKKILLDYNFWHDEKKNTCGYRNLDGHVFVTYAGEPFGERYLKQVIDLICESEKNPTFHPTLP